MSDDLRNAIKTAALNVIAREWRDGGERVATIERGLAYAEQIADAILDGGIEVRPGVRIMAVEEVTTEKIRTEDLEWLMSTNPQPLRRYREATDATSAPQPRNCTPVTPQTPQMGVGSAETETAPQNASESDQEARDE